MKNGGKQMMKDIKAEEQNDKVQYEENIIR